MGCENYVNKDTIDARMLSVF